MYKIIVGQSQQKYTKLDSHKVGRTMTSIGTYQPALQKNWVHCMHIVLEKYTHQKKHLKFSPILQQMITVLWTERKK